jgi:hypothetical protein
MLCKYVRLQTVFPHTTFKFQSVPNTHHRHHHHHISVTELGHLLTHSDLMHPEVSSKVCHDSFCQLGNSVSLPITYHTQYTKTDPHGTLGGSTLTFWTSRTFL